jgi:hypothetical protein
MGGGQDGPDKATLLASLAQELLHSIEPITVLQLKGQVNATRRSGRKSDGRFWPEGHFAPVKRP